MRGPVRTMLRRRRPMRWSVRARARLIPTLRQIVESPDIVPAVRGSGLWPSFGGPLATAIGQFGGRTLLRSRQHRVILAFYLGIGFAMTVSFIKSPAVRGQLAVISESDPWHKVNAPMLAAIAVIAGC